MKFYEGNPILMLRLETFACSPTKEHPEPIRDAVHSAMSVAAKLNVVTVTNMNGCDLMCFPGDEDVDAKLDALKNAWAMNAKATA